MVGKTFLIILLFELALAQISTFKFKKVAVPKFVGAKNEKGYKCKTRIECAAMAAIKSLKEKADSFSFDKKDKTGEIGQTVEDTR